LRRSVAESSVDDLALTRRLADAGEVMGIELSDHINLGLGDRWKSLKRDGQF
jgi:DNA repair protein RadC